MNVVGAGGEIDVVQPPDWTSLFNDELEIAAATDHWRRITIDMREAGTLAPANAHAMQRLVCGYIFHDRATCELAERGLTIKPKRGNARAITRLSPAFDAWRGFNSDVTALEHALGVSPRGRGSVTKVQRGKKASRAADAYLRPVPKAG